MQALSLQQLLRFYDQHLAPGAAAECGATCVQAVEPPKAYEVMVVELEGSSAGRWSTQMGLRQRLNGPCGAGPTA